MSSTMRRPDTIQRRDGNFWMERKDNGRGVRCVIGGKGTYAAVRTPEPLLVRVRMQSLGPSSALVAWADTVLAED